MKKWLFVIILLSVTATGAMARMLVSAKRDASIAERNLAVLEDTMTRYVRDSVAAVSLMAFQQDVNNDSILSLNGALGLAVKEKNQTLTTLTAVRVELGSVKETLESVSVVDVEPDEPGEEAAREATFAIEGPPIDGSLTVTVPPDRAIPWGLSTDLAVRGFNATYALGCDELRSAVMNFEAPEWVNMRLIRGEVQPDMCHPLSQPLLSFSTDKSIWAAGGIVLGVVIAKTLLDDDDDSGDYNR